MTELILFTFIKISYTWHKQVTSQKHFSRIIDQFNFSISSLCYKLLCNLLFSTISNMKLTLYPIYEFLFPCMNMESTHTQLIGKNKDIFKTNFKLLALTDNCMFIRIEGARQYVWVRSILIFSKENTRVIFEATNLSILVPLFSAIPFILMWMLSGDMKNVYWLILCMPSVYFCQIFQYWLAQGQLLKKMYELNSQQN